MRYWNSEEKNGINLIYQGEKIMKLQLLATLTLLTPLFFTSAVKAENPLHLQQLSSTGACFQCDLSGADLRGAHLIGADLRGANLQGADLTEANLEGADLTGANLTGANLTSAFVTNADFKEANLNAVNFTRAKIYHANVYGASMNGLIISDAEIFNTGIGIGGDDAVIPSWD